LREILFRGKRLDNDEWIEGYYVRATHHWHKHGVHEDWIIAGAAANGGWFAIHERRAVDPATVGQYTGRKDKNGKRVFEGDILRLFSIWADGTVEPDEVPVIVQFWENDQCYVLTTKDGHHCDDFGNLGKPEYYEVIGNIHDNPELLEATV
jgi:uncharacterized phage protein (TIGR01671 family)